MLLHAFDLFLAFFLHVVDGLVACLYRLVLHQSLLSLQLDHLVLDERQFASQFDLEPSTSLSRDGVIFHVHFDSAL